MGVLAGIPSEGEIIRRSFYKSGFLVLAFVLTLTDGILLHRLTHRLHCDPNRSYAAFCSQYLPQEGWDALFALDAPPALVADALTTYQLCAGLSEGRGTDWTDRIPFEEFSSVEKAKERLFEIKTDIFRAQRQGRISYAKDKTDLAWREDGSDNASGGQLASVYESLLDLNVKIWKNAKTSAVFPVGSVPDNAGEYSLSYEDSWGYERTYGGERTHEGCDLMASVNERNVYPVLSVCDGTVEKKGWLTLGGYRLGVRSDNGVYFYYAHLASYGDLEVGDEVTAGTLLGRMGDTGYGETEGTVGNFPVHLHFGIYLTGKDGREFAANPYPFLRYLQNRAPGY